MNAFLEPPFPSVLLTQTMEASVILFTLVSTATEKEHQGCLYDGEHFRLRVPRDRVVRDSAAELDRALRLIVLLLPISSSSFCSYSSFSFYSYYQLQLLLLLQLLLFFPRFGKVEIPKKWLFRPSLLNSTSQF